MSFTQSQYGQYGIADKLFIGKAGYVEPEQLVETGVQIGGQLEAQCAG